MTTCLARLFSRSCQRARCLADEQRLHTDQPQAVDALSKELDHGGKRLATHHEAVTAACSRFKNEMDDMLTWPHGQTMSLTTSLQLVLVLTTCTTHRHDNGSITGSRGLSISHCSPLTRPEASSSPVVLLIPGPKFIQLNQPPHCLTLLRWPSRSLSPRMRVSQHLQLRVVIFNQTQTTVTFSDSEVRDERDDALGSISPIPILSRGCIDDNLLGDTRVHHPDLTSGSRLRLWHSPCVLLIVPRWARRKFCIKRR